MERWVPLGEAGAERAWGPAIPPALFTSVGHQGGQIPAPPRLCVQRAGSSRRPSSCLSLSLTRLRCARLQPLEPTPQSCLMMLHCSPATLCSTPSCSSQRCSG